MKLFKTNYTKWIPFGINSHAHQHYIVFVRKNKKTGMLQFKSKRIQTSFYYGYFVPNDLIDVRDSWNKIISE
jgi:CRISPR/Cas system-associated endoribonuclease Cas2